MPVTPILATGLIRIHYTSVLTHVFNFRVPIRTPIVLGTDPTIGAASGPSDDKLGSEVAALMVALLKPLLLSGNTFTRYEVFHFHDNIYDLVFDGTLTDVGTGGGGSGGSPASQVTAVMRDKLLKKVKYTLLGYNSGVVTKTHVYVGSVMHDLVADSLLYTGTHIGNFVLSRGGQLIAAWVSETIQHNNRSERRILSP